MAGFRLTAAILLIILFISGCGSGKESGESTGTTSMENSVQTSQTRTDATNSQSPSTSVEDPIRIKISGMTVDEKIGQLLVFGFDGIEPDEKTKALFKRFKPGGLIVMGDNVKSASQLLKLVNSLKADASGSGIPPFMSIDEEGGRVSRMPPEVSDLPSAWAIGGKGSESLAFGTGNVIAGELKAFGFNMDFAPVLDIWSNPQNTVIGDRAFGSDADTVAAMGIQVMKGIASAGVIPVVKHFPGHGDTSQDSHLELPVSYNTLGRLESFELKPFEEAIGNGAEAVMVAHILLAKIDGKFPASLSKTFITDILRSQLGFGGVVITDDMTMGAIVKNYGLGDAAVASFLAGSDLIMVVHGYENELAVAEALKAACTEGRISVGRLDESVYRILKLKDKYSLSSDPVQSVDIKKLNAEINAIAKTVKNK